MNASPRLLVLGAHPDDAEFHAGGLIARYHARGYPIKLVSVTDGGAGHHWRQPEQLIRQRREEAREAGRRVGAAYETWDFPDAALEATLALRARIIGEIRAFAPDLVLTHRPNDYHPDHRAVGQAVQDASYLVTVPLVVPEIPALPRDPVVAYMPDLFTRPYPFVPHVALDITSQLELILDMLACHRSQVFEFLPYHQGLADLVPVAEPARRQWLRTWFGGWIRPRADRFRAALCAAYGDERGAAIEFSEAFEISEYARGMEPSERQRLFPRD